MKLFILMQTSSKDFRSVDIFVLVLAWQVADCDSKKSKQMNLYSVYYKLHL